MRSAPTISFDWRPSRAWRLVRWTSLAVGALCLLWAGLEPWAKFAIALLGVWLEGRNLRFERFWKDSSWRLDNEGDWRWRRSDGSEGQAKLTQATLIGSLLVLNLRVAGRRIDLSIWPDQVHADTRRRLGVRLRRLPQRAALPEL